MRDARHRAGNPLLGGGRAVRPKLLYLVLAAVSGLLAFMAFTTYGVYVVRAAGLDPLQLVLVGTAVEASVFLAEVPTGVVADAYSRRLSVIVGFAVTGAGIGLIGASPTFAWIALGHAVWGVGAAFVSGALEAWLTDEVGEQDAAPVYVRATQINSAARLTGVPLGVVLASVQLQLPYLTVGALYVALAALLLFTMTESGYTPASRDERGSWTAMAATFRSGVRIVRARSALVAILAIALITGMSREGFDRLEPLQLLDNIGFPAGADVVVWFGIISAGSLLGGVVAAGLASRATNLTDARALIRTLLALAVVLTATAFAFALAGSLWLALAALWLMSSVRTAIGPLTLVWLNRDLDPSSRATVISMWAQADALGQAGGGPMLGLLGTWRTVRTALVAASVLMLPALPLYGREFRSAASDERDAERDA